MVNKKLDLTDQFDWRGTPIIAEVYKTMEVNNIRFKQVQAVCFADDDQIILYEHRDG